ncbi:hypothetical protein AX14_004379 [Amanita brunnescens Koide BX004]|nr:hypothetical protein AX14_004379 [Amanita brunnescens Koide BX004]
MDQGPERISKPPARLKQGLLQPPVISGLTPPLVPPAFAPAEKPGVALKVHKVECWVFDRMSPITASTGGTLTTDQITNWLRAPSPTTKGDVRPAIGLRLLCLEQEDSMKWPFDKGTFEAIQHALGLTKTSSYFNLPKSGACGKYLGISGQPIFVYHRSNNNGTISTVLKYDSAANVTTGYALLGPRISLENLGARICSQFPAFPHPLLVPTVLIELTATDLMRELYHINRLLTQSEYKTQSGDWEIQDSLANADSKSALKAAPAYYPGALLTPEDSYWHDETASEMQKEPSYWKDMSREMEKCEDNYQLARILGFLSCRFSFMNVAVQCSLSMVEFTLQEIDLMKDYTASANRRRLNGVMNNAGLRHRVEFLASNMRHIALFGAIGQRMQTQQNVVST